MKSRKSLAPWRVLLALCLVPLIVIARCIKMVGYYLTVALLLLGDGRWASIGVASVSATLLSWALFRLECDLVDRPIYTYRDILLVLNTELKQRSVICSELMALRGYSEDEREAGLHRPSERWMLSTLAVLSKRGWVEHQCDCGTLPGSVRCPSARYRLSPAGLKAKETLVALRERNAKSSSDDS